MEHYPLRPYRWVDVESWCEGARQPARFEWIISLCPTWSGDGLLILDEFFPSGVGIWHLPRLDQPVVAIHIPVLDHHLEKHWSIRRGCPRSQDYLLCSAQRLTRFTVSCTVLWSTNFTLARHAATEWTANGTVLVAMGKSIFVLDGASGNKLTTVEIPIAVAFLAYDTSGLLYGTEYQTRTIWKILTLHQEELREFIPHVERAPEHEFCFNSANHILACEGHHRSVWVTDAGGHIVHVDLPDSTSAVACLSDGRVVVACLFGDYSYLCVF